MSSIEQIDPAEVMDQHAPQPSMQDGRTWCRVCTVRTDNPGGPCLPYLLARDLIEAARERDANWQSYLSRVDELQKATEAYLHVCRELDRLAESLAASGADL